MASKVSRAHACMTAKRAPLALPQRGCVDKRSTATPAGNIISALPKPLAETNKAAATAPMPKAKP